MVNNHSLNTAKQKAFINGVPGCSEHHLKLLSILQEACRRRKSLCICWLDLANAFGSVHHDLITFAVAHYHAPSELIQLMSNIYDGFTQQTPRPSHGLWPISVFSLESIRVTPPPPFHHLQHGDEHPGGLHYPALLCYQDWLTHALQ